MCPFYVVAPEAHDQRGGAIPATNGYDAQGGNARDRDGGFVSAARPASVPPPPQGHHVQYGRLVAVQSTWEEETWRGAVPVPADQQLRSAPDQKSMPPPVSGTTAVPPPASQRLPSPTSARSATLPRTTPAAATAKQRPWTPTTMIVNTTTIDGGSQQHLPTPPATPSPRSSAGGTEADEHRAPAAVPMLTDYAWRVTKSGDKRQIDEADWVVPFSWRHPPAAVRWRVSSSVRSWTELERWERASAERRMAPERGLRRRGKSPPRYGRYAEFVEPRVPAAQQQQQFVAPKVVPQQQQQQFGISRNAQHVGTVQGEQPLPRMVPEHLQRQHVEAVQGNGHRKMIPHLHQQQHVYVHQQQHVQTVQRTQEEQKQQVEAVQGSVIPYAHQQQRVEAVQKNVEASQGGQQLTTRMMAPQQHHVHGAQSPRMAANQYPKQQGQEDKNVQGNQPNMKPQQNQQNQVGPVHTALHPYGEVQTAPQHQVGSPSAQMAHHHHGPVKTAHHSHGVAVQTAPQRHVGFVQTVPHHHGHVETVPQRHVGFVQTPPQHHGSVQMAFHPRQHVRPVQMTAQQQQQFGTLPQQQIGAVQQGEEQQQRHAAADDDDDDNEPAHSAGNNNLGPMADDGTRNHWEWQECTVQLMPADFDEEAPNATMETKVSGGGAAPKRVGRWTLAQLRQTDGIIPSQAGWNKGDSQKLMTNFGTPRNTTTKVKVENLAEIPEEVLLKSHGEVRLQSGTNRFASQKGFVSFGTGRDVCREGVNVNVLPADLEPLPEEKIRASDGIVRLQAGTNKFDSQKGMTLFGTGRRETTRMKDSKHPEYSHERDIDNTEIPLQMGTNKFASQKGMTGFGTNRRETTKMLDTSHPEYSHEQSIDQTSIPYQMGSNKYASQKGMTGFGQPRWEVLDPSISYQNRKSQGMVRLQSGTNRFASQAGMTGFGTPRNTTYEAEAGELPYEDMKKSEAIIPSQAGWNKGDSQKLMTKFGTPRDVKGTHLKRIWELEYPEEAEVSLDRL